jgi:sugar phosphate isomerase/epimerase
MHAMFNRKTLVIAALLVATGLTAWQSMAAERRERKGKGRWKAGMQVYTFNRFTFFEAVDKSKELGLRFIEAYPGQALSPDHKDLKLDHNMSAEAREMVKKKLAENKQKLINYGVVGLGKDEAANRKIFDFAKDMGIQTIVAEPEPGSFDLLDKLTEEYKINVAIHNHPKPSRYWNPEAVLEAVQGHSKRIGSCADTGHWMRSGLDPLECLKKLEGRIISSHFKDLNKKGPDAHDVPWGTGEGNAKVLLEEFKRQGFTGVFSIEYEYNWDNSMPDIAKCLEWFNATTKELYGGK